MEKYDVFKSEGGYRVCLATYGDDPIIDKCPWCKTLAGAKAVARDAKFDNETRQYGVFYGEGWMASLPSNDYETDYYSFGSRDEAVQAVISAMEKLGYTREYILCRRKDLLSKNIANS